MDWHWLLIPVGYLVGSFPTALLIGRLVNRDPTREGSGNPGATNMFRIAGRKAGIATLIFDIAKALVVTLVARAIEGPTLAAVVGGAAVVGHVFPLLRQSRGGKGVACFGGMTIGTWPLIAPIGLVVWVAAAQFSGRSFIGAMVAVPTVALATIVLWRPWPEIAVAIGLTVLIVARHRSNITAALADRRTRTNQ